MRNEVIDSLVVLWMVATVVLLFVFARYSYRCWRVDGIRELYSRISFFNGLIIHHVGNLVLLFWFWTKVHDGEIALDMKATDRWVIIIGCAVACCGVLYKVRIFTDSAAELLVTAFITLVLSALSIFALYGGLGIV